MDASEPDKKTEIFVPRTEMGRRYLKVHAEVEEGAAPWKRGERTAHQRSLAEADLRDVGSLASDFIASVDQFARYLPRDDEAFYDERPPDALLEWRKAGTPTTARIAARLETRGIRAQPPLPPLTYIDRELVPSRTTSPSRFEEAKGTRIRLDLLFSASGQPVVAEVKALSDENAYYALIQGLAVCAQLAPSAQRERLHKRYPDLGKTGAMQLWIVLASHNSRGQDKAAMLDLAHEISIALLQDPAVAAHVATIACVDAEIPQSSGPVLLVERWSSAAG